MFSQGARPQVGAIVAPARWVENVFQLIGKLRSPLYILGNVKKFVRGNFEKVIRVNVFGKPVNRLVICPFFGKGAKHSIPYNQNTRMVLVQVADVRRMMNAVVRRSVEE